MNKERIFEFVYLMAFRDATMRKAFPKRNNESDESYRDRKEGAFLKAKSIACNYIDHLIEGQDEIKPETYILQICQDLKCYGFTFGNAQKLINMMAKYMYIMCYEDDTKRKLFKNCDCPMDGVMINALISSSNFNVPQGFSWSRMETKDDGAPREYKEFQRIVSSNCNDGIYPIEYDFENWRQ